VHRRIEERIGITPSRSVNPDEAVGLGAGIYANLGSDPDKVKLQDVLPIAIGVGLPGGRFQPVLRANTPIPASRTIPLTTVRDYQDTIEFEVFQGTSDILAETEYLGTFVIDDIPRANKGEQSFGVEFALNAECLLYLTAMNYNSGQLYEKTLTTPMTPEQVIQRLKLMELGRNAFGIATARIADNTEPGVWIRVSRWIKSLFGSSGDRRASS
jgi:molecular chaperone DnaK